MALAVINAQLNTLTQIVKDFNQELKRGTLILTLTAREAVEESDSTIPPEVTLVTKEFCDVFPEDLPSKLPPMHDLQHAVDLVLGACLPILPHYRINRTEHAEVKG